MESLTTSYLEYAPDQDLLLPQSLKEWLPEGHLAYFISDTVEQLDLSAFHERYAGGGPRNQPFHPAMMVKVLIYGYATGVFSSRKIARKLHEDVAFRVLAADNFPAHRTISDFRLNHLEAFAGLFVKVVELAQECGLIKLGTIAVDGTKVKANASRHKAMSYARMVEKEQQLTDQIEQLLEQARATRQSKISLIWIFHRKYSVEKIVWPLYAQPRSAWNNASASQMRLKADTRAMIVSLVTVRVTQSEVLAIRGISACLKMTHRQALQIQIVEL